MSKYLNRKVDYDGHTFDSAKERDRYATLRLLERAGEIRNLRLQPKYPITINGMTVCKVIGDFEYWPRGGGEFPVVEDVKSVFTRKLPVYRLKAKLFRAVYGFEITEVTQ